MRDDLHSITWCLAFCILSSSDYETLSLSWKQNHAYMVPVTSTNWLATLRVCIEQNELSILEYEHLAVFYLSQVLEVAAVG